MDLHAACRAGDLSQIKIAFFTDPSRLNEKDPSLGWCPLYRTVICGHFEAASYLLQQGADPNVCNTLGESSLHQAADNSMYEIAELLIRFKANTNSQQRDGDTPLHHASFRGDCKMIEILLQGKADPNIANFMFGRTALHYAVDCGHIDCMKVLISHRADPYIKDKQGKSAFDLCNSTQMLASLKEVSDIRRSRDGEQSPIGEVTTYFVNETNSNDRISDIFETFGDHRESHNIKVSIVSPVSEQSEKSFKVSPIYAWLEKNRLEDCYETLANAGYSNIDTLVRQMLGPMPVTEKTLKELGIGKPGHRRLLLAKLEEEAGLGKSQSQSSVHRAKSKSWIQCCTSNQGTMQVKSYPTLAEWLEEIGLVHLHDLFVDAGYESYQSLVEIQKSLNPLNSRILDQEIKIKEVEQRMMIMRKLQMDTEFADDLKNKITFDGTQKVGCEYCGII